MNIHHQKHLKTWLVSTTLLVILAGGFVARTAFAKLAANTAVAIARTSDNGQTSDAHQWLVNITLVAE